MLKVISHNENEEKTLDLQIESEQESIDLLSAQIEASDQTYKDLLDENYELLALKAIAKDSEENRGWQRFLDEIKRDHVIDMEDTVHFLDTLKLQIEEAVRIEQSK